MYYPGILFAGTPNLITSALSPNPQAIHTTLTKNIVSYIEIKLTIHETVYGEYPIA